MREIKFRAWMNEWDDGGKMFYKIISLTPDFSEVQISLDGDNRYDGDFTVGKDVKLMQYTGLKDKNGVEIYEGDIVRLTDDWDNDSVHQVEYCAEYGYPAFDVKPSIDVESNGLSHFMATGEIEVIGNIYENPELLEANQ